MALDTLGRLLAGEFRDPDDGRPLIAPIPTVVIEDSLEGREADLVGALELGSQLAVVSDPTTRRVLGRRVEQALGRVAHWSRASSCPSTPQPDLETVDRLRKATAEATP